ncbi:MAG: four helix bundle suffix domain-containing protein [Muribaculaceae bacterium]|nr:four helix bundle suffix domain-containing protein [Muribaculaceae bacterium]
MKIRHYEDGTASVMRKPVVYTSLRFYQRSDVLCQLTHTFCARYLPPYGDRTVDQMVQAARSIKQNIAEGSRDGSVSMEIELKLLGVAAGSNKELLEDYHDYLKRKGLADWHATNNPRFGQLLALCRDHCTWAEYEPFIAKMNYEELANVAICLCHQVDAALTKYMARKDQEFTTEGGIRERMSAARREQRNTQQDIIKRQAQAIAALEQEVAYLHDEIAALQHDVAYLRHHLQNLQDIQSLQNNQ